MYCKLVQVVDGQLVSNACSMENILDFMWIRGFVRSGLLSNAHARCELQGLPTFENVNGPMWDGDCVRYETPEAYALLSE